MRDAKKIDENIEENIENEEEENKSRKRLIIGGLGIIGIMAAGAFGGIALEDEDSAVEEKIIPTENNAEFDGSVENLQSEALKEPSNVLVEDKNGNKLVADVNDVKASDKIIKEKKATNNKNKNKPTQTNDNKKPAANAETETPNQEGGNNNDNNNDNSGEEGNNNPDNNPDQGGNSGEEADKPSWNVDPGKPETTPDEIGTDDGDKNEEKEPATGEGNVPGGDPSENPNQPGEDDGEDKDMLILVTILLDCTLLKMVNL